MINRRITVICTYNNREILNSMLEAGLRAQIGVDIERLYYNDARSAASAYNDAIKKASSDYLVFIHQDIRFSDEQFLIKLINYIEDDRNCIYGLCGAKMIMDKGIVTTYSNVFHGLKNQNIGKSINNKIYVDGLDEIFVAFHKDISNIIKFDELNMNGWHLFVEDICIQASMKNLKIAVLPLTSQHKNSLEMPKYMHI